MFQSKAEEDDRRINQLEKDLKEAREKAEAADATYEEVKIKMMIKMMEIMIMTMMKIMPMMMLNKTCQKSFDDENPQPKTLSQLLFNICFQLISVLVPGCQEAHNLRLLQYYLNI